LLRASALPELIADSPRQYEEKALELAADPVRLKELRGRLSMRNTPIFDTERYTRNLEAVYQAMYERQRSGSPPAHLNDWLAN
jgi:protein O-GlcNAc transferase